jgi:antitoxin (DNA-binding transcriptional repressor) of toxin-antitoxin stability system
MEKIAISKFKATCLAVIEEVCRTGKPVLVTKLGKPIAEINPPPSTADDRARLFGLMRGKGRIVGNVEGPAIDPEDWDALGT